MDASLIMSLRRKPIVLHLQFFVIGLALATVSLHAEPDREKQDCRRQLSFLYEAIQAHYKRYQRYPNWLSDLVPEFLANPKTLICPRARSLGIRGPEADGILRTVYSDPKTSYSYERCIGALERDIWKGAPITYAEYKDAQIKRVGSVVPIVRCPNHGVHLNLSHSGIIYESGLYWEELHSAQISSKELDPEHLFAAKKEKEPPPPNILTQPLATLLPEEEDQRPPMKKRN